jgi:alpha-galactosidase/6-phospho-beta-glucosidase family protein
MKFNKLPNPKNKAEIKIFVNNLISYINFLFSCPSIKNNNKLNEELFIFKYKLETRYNDYRNHGLNEQYFINKLSQHQEELINKIKEAIKNEKKEENMNLGSLNINNIINIHTNYFFMGKKRKKSLSEIKSITDGSSSYEGDFN